MTLDISLEAIEADLRIAERGGQVATIAMARAQVRATLLAAQPVAPMVAADGHSLAVTETVGSGVTDIHIERSPFRDVFTVPTLSPWEDRVTAAAILLGIPLAYLEAAVRPLTEKAEAPEAPTEEDAHAGEPSEEDDVDADFFAEAKKARKRK